MGHYTRKLLRRQCNRWVVWTSRGYVRSLTARHHYTDDPSKALLFASEWLAKRVADQSPGRKVQRLKDIK